MVFLVSLLSVEAGSARVIKVLPHYLDLKGRHTLSPSLYERDAYQVQLRNNPDQVSTIRFDINWSARGIKEDNLKMKIEVRGSETSTGEIVVIEESNLKKGFLESWAKIKADREAYKKIGKVVSWKVTIFDGDTEIAHSQSFLW